MKRATKEQAAKDKRSDRKRKSPAEETSAPKSAKAKMARIGEVLEPVKAREPFRAPVARMSETQVM